MMIGGETEAIQHLDPIFATLAPGSGQIARTPGREKLAGRPRRAICTAVPTARAISSKWFTTVSSTA